MLNKIIVTTAMFLLAAGGISLTGSSDGCNATTTRPCYDKTKSNAVSILGKNAENTFKACMSNSAPNETGINSVLTKLCSSEQFTYTYCYEGKSHVYLRKFEGFCNPPPPPPPPPPPAICADGLDNDSDGLIDYPKDPGCVSNTDTDESNPPPQPVTFRVTSPNGGETLAFGSSFPIRWEGGDPAWPIELSIISGDGRVVRRGIVWGLANDGIEDWIVDLPPGSYKMYARGCSDPTCTSTAWDYSDNAFNVVATTPLQRIISDNITNKTIVVLSPSGGESWNVGTEHELIWSGASDNSTIDISLIDYTANKTYSVLTNGTTNDGKYLWTIPANVPSGSYTIYVSCTLNCTAPYGWYGYSFEPFNITNP